jgi:hypothetical protein
MTSASQQEQGSSFNPAQILYLEVRANLEAKIFYHEILQSPYKSDPDFRAMIKEIIKNNGHPEQTRRPTFIQDSSRNLTITSLGCNGSDTEVIFYIPKGMADFDPQKVPFTKLDRSIMINPRLFFVEQSGDLEEIDKFSANNNGPHCQLAVLSYKGTIAARDRGNKPYTYSFHLEAAKEPFFPGSGDIGHPGGNYP